MVEKGFSRWFCRFAGLVLCLLVGVSGAYTAVRNCTVEPFSVPLGNVTVVFNPNRPAAHRGMKWQVGSEPALLSMQVGTTLNSTFIADTAVCSSRIDNGCVFWRGGLYQNTSDTWEPDMKTKDYPAAKSNKGWDYLNEEKYKNQDPISQFPRGWDNVRIEGTERQISLPEFPIITIDYWDFPFGQGMVGLATDSAFLDEVVQRNMSPSRSWALDYGRSSVDGAAKTGEVVFGGYNRNKVDWQTFTNYTVFPNLSKPCPLQVQVNELKWGTVDLMEGQDPFMACIEPAYWTTIMPIQVRSNFHKTVMAQARPNTTFWQSTWEYLYYNNTDGTELPGDDFTITLDGGFSVTMPREEWIFPAYQVDKNEGGWAPIPGSIQTTIGNAGFKPNVEPKIPFLGAPFLSVVYLAVDYEKNIFSLAPTKEVQDPNAQTPPDLVRLGCEGWENATVITPTPEPASKVPAIVGGAVGGVVGLVAMIGAVLCFMRRRKNQETPSETAMIARGPGVPDQTKEQNEIQMMGFNQHPYDAPPAFSPTSTPAPYTPTSSPGPYTPINLTTVPPRRPLPGQYPNLNSPPMQHEFYGQRSQHVPSFSVTSGPAELKGTEIASELSCRPNSEAFSRAFSDGNFDDTSVISGYTAKR